MSHLTSTKFSSLSNILDDSLLRTLNKLNFQFLTLVQEKTLPLSILGRDVCATAPTGSGKTLAFVLPILQKLIKASKNSNEMALILQPTRELAIQTSEIIKLILKSGHFDNITEALIIGGTNKFDQKVLLGKGTNILVGTPGRILYHLQNTESLKLHSLKFLVLDEAEKMLEMGFRKAIETIADFLPTKKQNLLFSATLSPKISELFKLIFKSSENPVYIDIYKYLSNGSGFANQNYEKIYQMFTICDSKSRLKLLFRFISEKRLKALKIMIFLSNCASVEFHYKFFSQFKPLNIIALHGNLTQSKRSEIFSTFKSYNCLKEKQTICLLCTDVAARGLDVPDVDWVLHYDLPQNSDTYIHRIGRCARDMCSDQFGQSLLVFNPWETSFIDILKNKKIDLREIIFENDELPNIDEKYFGLIQSNTELKTLAQSALKGYIKTYLSRQDKQVFDPTKLNISEICQNFGFQSSPSNDLEVQFNRSIKKLKKKSLKLARKTKYKSI